MQGINVYNQKNVLKPIDFNTAKYNLSVTSPEVELTIDNILYYQEQYNILLETKFKDYQINSYQTFMYFNNTMKNIKKN